MEKSKSRTQRSPKTYELRLYVAGQTPKSLAAFANLKRSARNIWQGSTTSK